MHDSGLMCCGNGLANLRQPLGRGRQVVWLDVGEGLAIDILRDKIRPTVRRLSPAEILYNAAVVDLRCVVDLSQKRESAIRVGP